MANIKIKALAVLTAAAAFAAPSASVAGEFQGGYCQSEGHGQGGPGGGDQTYSDLCAHGPAGCIAIGLYARIEPTIVPAVTTQLARSTTNAWAWNGMGGSHADAAVAKADMPPVLGEGLVESRCDSNVYAQDWFMFGNASGTAETERLYLDLFGYGIPVALNVDVLREDGWSSTGAGANDANVVGVNGTAFGNPVSINNSQPPNSSISFGAATLYFNERFVTPGWCSIYSGDALRLVVTDPFTGLPVATVIVSWVSTSTCSV